MASWRLSENKKTRVYHLHLPDLNAEELLAGVLDRTPVSGFTHTYYRYPARFSPQFARAAIRAFSEPGDLIIDPFVGGGTTLVESMALGRRAVGVDISSLATFVSSVKTTLLENKDLLDVSGWLDDVVPSLKLNRRSHRQGDWAENGYFRNVDGRDTWRIRKALELALDEIEALPGNRQRRFARCILLRTGQWALDGRVSMPSIEQFRQRVFDNAEDMLFGMRELKAEVQRTRSTLQNSYSRLKKIRCFQRPAESLGGDNRIRMLGCPRLILTSPPYPGVHVLYHRWQVNGGKEAPAPFWIANKLDGAGASYYTMGDRKEQELLKYYCRLEASFSALAKLADDNTLVIQMVAFGDPTWQLPRYLSAMRNAGFVEALIPELATSDDGRLWRDVPNRKWHATSKGNTPGSRELVLFHVRR